MNFGSVFGASMILAALAVAVITASATTTATTTTTIRVVVGLEVFIRGRIACVRKSKESHF